MTITYKESGVDTNKGQLFVKQIKKYAKKSQGPEVLSGIGGFAALFNFPFHKYKKPILVSATDGVGTKIELAGTMGIHNTIGQDLVAMCVNDLLTTGAKPLFFLDYLVTGQIDPPIHVEVVKGIARACKKCSMALIGGETAEHPGIDASSRYDLAGFSVGVVEEKNILPKTNIQNGDIFIGFPSSGVHSNGFSLIRKIIEKNRLDLKKIYPGFKKKLGQVLLEPTGLYTNILPFLNDRKLIKGACHITGGGFYENIPRILPDNTMAEITTDNLPQRPIFDFFKKIGPIEPREMFSTFNMGVGLVIIATEKNSNVIKDLFPKCFYLGKIKTSRKRKAFAKILGIDIK